MALIDLGVCNWDKGGGSRASWDGGVVLQGGGGKWWYLGGKVRAGWFCLGV